MKKLFDLYLKSNKLFWTTVKSKKSEHAIYTNASKTEGCLTYYLAQ